MRDNLDFSNIDKMEIGTLEGNSSNADIFDVEALIFEGGGVLGIGHAGALKKLHELGIMKNIKYFAGSSVGSLLAGLCACKASTEIIESVVNINFDKILDDDYGFVRDTERLWHSFGYYKGKELLKQFRKYLKMVTGDGNITFAQVYEKYGTELTITVTDVYKKGCKTLYHCKNTVPNMQIAEAARQSCTYPLIFASIDYTSDGGILDNYPIHIYRDKKVLGLKFESRDHSKDDENSERPSNVIEYVESIIYALRRQALKYYESEDDAANTIRIPTFGLKSTNFSLTEEEKIKLYNSGYNSAAVFFNQII